MLGVAVLGTAALHPHTHSFSPALACAPLIYHSIPKQQSRVHVAIAPARWGYLGVAVLGVAVLGTAVLGVAVLGTAVLHRTLTHSARP